MAPVSFVVSVRVAVALVVVLPPVMPLTPGGVCGPVVSIDQVAVTAALRLPYASSALTEKVCEPSGVTPVYVFGDVHAA